MSCERVHQIDLAGFLASPRDDAHAAFREHYPVCAECAAEVRAFTELDLLLRGSETHPSPEVLLRYEDEPMSLPDARRAELDRHVALCAACRDELRVLRQLQQLPVAAAAARQVRAPGLESAPLLASVLARLRRWLWNPALPYALVLVLLVPLVVQRWAVLEEERNLLAPTPPRADAPARAPAPQASRSFAEGMIGRDEQPAPALAAEPARARARELKEYAVARELVAESALEFEEAPAAELRQRRENAPLARMKQSVPSAGPAAGRAGEVAIAGKRDVARKLHSAQDVDSKSLYSSSAAPAADAISAALVAALEGDERVFIVPAAQLPAGAGEVELRIRLAGGRRELVERRTLGPDGALEVRVPAAWLGEGQHIVEISALAETAGEKRTRTFLLVAR